MSSNLNDPDAEGSGNDEPGAVPMWFGKHEGTRLDKLDENYRRFLLNLYLENPNPYPNLIKFKELHDRYTTWLDERQSPLSTIVWFGKYKGHEIRVLYDNKRRWRWFVQNCEKWGAALREIELRYRKWKEKQTPKCQTRRAVPIIANPVGEKLGLRDDEPPSDTGSYESDDGFVVRSGEDENENEVKHNFLSDGEDEDITEDFGSNGVQIDEEIPSLSENDHDGSSSSSLPSLSNLSKPKKFKKNSSRKSRLASRKYANVSSNELTVHADSESDPNSSPFPRRRRLVRARVSSDRILAQNGHTESSGEAGISSPHTPLSGDDSDDVIITSDRKRKVRHPIVSRGSALRVSSEDDSDNAPLATPTRNRHKLSQSAASEDSDDVMPMSGKRRKRNFSIPE